MHLGGQRFDLPEKCSKGGNARKGSGNDARSFRTTKLHGSVPPKLLVWAETRQFFFPRQAFSITCFEVAALPILPVLEQIPSLKPLVQLQHQEQKASVSGRKAAEVQGKAAEVQGKAVSLSPLSPHLPFVVPNDAKMTLSMVFPPAHPRARLLFSATRPHRAALGWGGDGGLGAGMSATSHSPSSTVRLLPLAAEGSGAN